MRWGLPLLAGVALVAAPRGPVYTEPRPVLSLGVQAPIVEIEPGDFDGDGRRDVVATRIRFGTNETLPLTILLGDGRGRLRDATTSLFASAIPRVTHVSQILVGDFNGDRRDDLYVADSGRDSSDPPPFPGYPDTLVLSGPGGRLVDASANLPRDSDFTHSAAAADVDRDGDLDVYQGNIPSPLCCTKVPARILRNDGQGRFEVAEGALPASVTNGSTAPPRYTGSRFADVNGDGAPDLVLAGDRGHDSQLLLNDGAGRFSLRQSALPPRPYGTQNTISLGTGVLDVNGDGRADLVMSHTRLQPFYKGRALQVLVNAGDGTFRDETSARLPQPDNEDQWVAFVDAVDLNGDGALDLASHFLGGFRFRQTPPWYLNDGAGRFRPLPPGTGGVVEGQFALLDANGDRALDVLTVDPSFDGSAERWSLSLRVLPPAAPRGITASRGLARFVRVSWRRSPGATSYEVWRSHVRVARTSTTRYLDRSAASGRRYAYTVRAVNAAGTSAPSAAALGVRSP